MAANLNLKPKTLEKIRQGWETGQTYQEIADTVPPLNKDQVRRVIKYHYWKRQKKTVVPKLDEIKKTNELVLYYLPHIRRVAEATWHKIFLSRVVLGSKEDAIQEAALYCLQYGTRYYDGVAPLDMYFRKMAVRGIMKRLKVAMARKRLVYQKNAPDVVPVDTSRLPERASAIDHVVEVLNRLEISQCLEILSPQHRRCVVFFYGLLGHEKLTQKAIGDLLGLTEQQARRAICYAVKEIIETFAKSA